MCFFSALHILKERLSKYLYIDPFKICANEWYARMNEETKKGTHVGRKDAASTHRHTHTRIHLHTEQ